MKSTIAGIVVAFLIWGTIALGLVMVVMAVAIKNGVDEAWRRRRERKLRDRLWWRFRTDLQRRHL